MIRAIYRNRKNEGFIKPNGIRMVLRADFTCINDVWTLGDFERDPN